MSYYDSDNLPFGVSSTDAAGMGINSWDSASVASEKYITELVRQGTEANAAFWRQQDAASQSSTSTGGPAGLHGAGSPAPGGLAHLIRQFSPGKITSSKDLAAAIEAKRRRLEQQRLQATRGLKQAAVLSWVVAAILLFMVLFHIQFFNASYRQVTYEYFIVRAGLLATLFSGWRFTSKVGKACTEAEKSCRPQLQALRQALDHSDAEDRLTPRFIHDFNEHYKKKTGKNMPYAVYQYTALFEQRLCLIPDASTLNKADMEHGQIIPLEQVRALALPGA